MTFGEIKVKAYVNGVVFDIGRVMTGILFLPRVQVLNCIRFEVRMGHVQVIGKVRKGIDIEGEENIRRNIKNLIIYRSKKRKIY